VTPRFRRILLKLSGEALMGDLEYGADPGRIAAIAHAVKNVSGRGVEVAIVVGGGNVYRGLKGAAAGMDRATGDYMAENRGPLVAAEPAGADCSWQGDRYRAKENLDCT
jgi:hypothetical protein